jgi:hypothetical protein
MSGLMYFLRDLKIVILKKFRVVRGYRSSNSSQQLYQKKVLKKARLNLVGGKKYCIYVNGRTATEL